MEFFSKVARRPVLAGRLLVDLGREYARKSHAKGKSKGQRWDPQILMSLQMQPIRLSVCLPILSWVGTQFWREQNWQELAESRAFHSHRLRIWETGALDWDYRD